MVEHSNPRSAIEEQKSDFPAATLSRRRFIQPFDLMLGILRHIRILIGIPIAVAVLCYLLAYLLPKTYTSEAYLVLNETQARDAEGLIRSPLVLNPVIDRFGSADVSPEENRRRFNGKLRLLASGDRKSAFMFILQVDDRIPSRASEIAQAVIDTWIEKSKPRNIGLERLNEALARSEEHLAAVVDLTKRFDKDATTLVLPSTMNGEIATPFVRLLDQRVSLTDQIVKLKSDIEGITRDVIAVPPMVPTEPSAPKKGLIAILGGLVAGIFTLGFVVARLSYANLDPIPQEKFKTLRKAFSWRRRKMS